jgi:ribonuclease HII
MAPTFPDFSHETALSLRGMARVAGIDEAGRGPLAGPVTAAAVVLNPMGWPEGLNDSKALGPARRAEIFEALADCAEVGIGWASVEEIDALDIRKATFLAMVRALEALPGGADHALIDGNAVPPDLPCAATALIKGDARCLSIAAASIVAKVARDRMMAELDAAFPGYGWAQNAGYPTVSHKAALQDLGVTPHHRRSFAPVHKML